MGQYDLSIGGDDDMAGDEEFGDDDFFGGSRPARRNRGAGRARNADDLTQVFNFPQGPSGTTQFAANATGVLTGRPQRPFRTERLAIASFIAPFFTITDLVIGRDSMFVNSEVASAEIFSQSGVGVALRGFIARPGIDIAMTVTNIDAGAAHPFYGSIVGPAALNA